MILGLLTLAADTIDAEDLVFIAALAAHVYKRVACLFIEWDGLGLAGEQVDGGNAVEQDRRLIDLEVRWQGRVEAQFQLDLFGGFIRPVGPQPLNANAMVTLGEAKELVQDAVAVHLLAWAW
ncbi:hypothetical protein D3C76_961570 [compost metagenome]